MTSRGGGGCGWDDPIGLRFPASGKDGEAAALMDGTEMSAKERCLRDGDVGIFAFNESHVTQGRLLRRTGRGGGEGGAEEHPRFGGATQRGPISKPDQEPFSTNRAAEKGAWKRGPPPNLPPPPPPPHLLLSHDSRTSHE